MQFRDWKGGNKQTTVVVREQKQLLGGGPVWEVWSDRSLPEVIPCICLGFVYTHISFYSGSRSLDLYNLMLR